MDREVRAQQRAQVRALLDRLAALAPGHAVELRIPPFAAVQLVDGPRHTRGTPGAVVEMDADTLVQLASGALTWVDGVYDGRIRASGERSDLSELFAALTSPMTP